MKLRVAALIASFAVACVLAGCFNPNALKFWIPSSAMEPTLSVGDKILVDHAAYIFAEPAEGDIVVFYPPQALGRTPFIKRIVAVPGDSLSLLNGKVSRNGKTVREAFVRQPASFDFAIRNYGIYVDGVSLDPKTAVIPPKKAWKAPDRVPPGYYVVLGDNRNDSDDSHLWGFMKRSQIIGKVKEIYWPLNHMKTF